MDAILKRYEIDGSKHEGRKNRTSAMRDVASSMVTRNIGRFRIGSSEPAPALSKNVFMNHTTQCQVLEDVSFLHNDPSFFVSVADV